jgi:hypothetical protein
VIESGPRELARRLGAGGVQVDDPPVKVLRPQQVRVARPSASRTALAW